jgi:hypothetical protein
MGGLQISTYISEGVQSQMKMVAAKYDMPGKNGILSGGKQRITNKEAYAILAVMCAPKNIEEMQRKLLKSSWPATAKHDYSNVEAINKYMNDYRTDMLIYIDRFEEKLKLLSYRKKAQAFLPTTLFKKGGAMGHPGLADYFIGGLPEKEFGIRVWMAVKEGDKNKCKDWETFIKLYMRVIERMEKRKNEEDRNKHIYLGAKKMVKEEEAQDSAVRKTREEARKKQRLHATLQLDEDSTEESDMENEPHEGEDNDDDMPSAILKANDSGSEDEDQFSELANMLQPTKDGLTGVCWKMVDYNKCDRVNCPWSHKEEDVTKARKLKQEMKAKGVKFPGPKLSTPAKHVNFTRGSLPGPKHT